MSVVLRAVMLLWLGIGILPCLIIQVLIAITLLDAVNYLQHYGMLRQKVKSGDRDRYKRVDLSHGWNSDNIATNVLLYHLQCFSENNAQPTRRYQSLLSYHESPALPAGYAGMILLALFPPVWSRVMDPRVLSHFEGDITQANQEPLRRKKILAKYSSAPKSREKFSEEDIISTTQSWQSAQYPGCNYTHGVEHGDRRTGFAPGTPFSHIRVRGTVPTAVCSKKNNFEHFKH